jgi:predicted lipoprotein with Yx(FWY)xxD motif
MPRLRTVMPALATTTLVSGALVAAGTATAGAANVPTATTAASTMRSAPAGHGVTVKSHHKKLGTYLVGSNGHALYVFEKDNGTMKSHCYHMCASDWPPFITHGKPKAAGKVKSSLLGTTKRKNGDKQVTYNGHPLYFFDDDTAAGQTNGEGIHEFGAEWNVVNKKGHEIKTD